MTRTPAAGSHVVVITAVVALNGITLKLPPTGCCPTRGAARGATTSPWSASRSLVGSLDRVAEDEGRSRSRTRSSTSPLRTGWLTEQESHRIGNAVVPDRRTAQLGTPRRHPQPLGNTSPSGLCPAPALVNDADGPPSTRVRRVAHGLADRDGSPMRTTRRRTSRSPHSATLCFASSHGRTPHADARRCHHQLKPHIQMRMRKEDETRWECLKPLIPTVCCPPARQ